MSRDSGSERKKDRGVNGFGEHFGCWVLVMKWRGAIVSRRGKIR
jgi:hypothetical protein